MKQTEKSGGVSLCQCESVKEEEEEEAGKRERAGSANYTASWKVSCSAFTGMEALPPAVLLLMPYVPANLATSQPRRSLPFKVPTSPFIAIDYTAARTRQGHSSGGQLRRVPTHGQVRLATSVSAQRPTLIPSNCRGASPDWKNNHSSLLQSD